jgi:hypothetical protein
MAAYYLVHGIEQPFFAHWKKLNSFVNSTSTQGLWPFLCQLPSLKGVVMATKKWIDLHLQDLNLVTFFRATKSVISEKSSKSGRWTSVCLISKYATSFPDGGERKVFQALDFCYELTLYITHEDVLTAA